MDSLTGKDYMTRDALELQSHPDFSAHAMRIITAVSNMTNEQLEHLDIYAAYQAANKERMRNG